MGKIIDCHVHVGSSSSLHVSGNEDTVIKIMNDNGVDHAIIFPMAGFEDPDGIQSTIVMNNRLAETLNKYPDRFLTGLGAAEPRHGKASLAEVDRVLGELKLKGLMFHNDFGGVPIDAPIMYEIVERASQYPDIVIMLHTAQHSLLEPPFMVTALARAFPTVKFLNAHPMMNPTQLGACIDQAQTCSNIYFDTTISYAHEFLIEKFVKEIGPDRLMYGSNCPYYHYSGYSLDKELIEVADISEEDKHKIFYENAIRFYNL